MNYPHIFNRLGLLLVVFSAIMAMTAAFFFLIEQFVLHHEVKNAARIALFISAGFGVLIGGSMWAMTRKYKPQFGRRDALLLVALSWIIGAALAALPYHLWTYLGPDALADHPFRSFADCYFEAMSGLTTTGATVLGSDGFTVANLPRSLLLWRAATHWLGGLGIVVLFVAVLPSLGVGGKRLFRVEAAGPSPEGLHPQIRDTARLLWYIYLILTAAQIILLATLGRMNLFDATCHAFATVSTGGFSTHDASAGYYYDRVAVDWIIILFMILGGANFGLFIQIARKRWREVFKDAEFRLYIIILTIGTALIVTALAFSDRAIELTTGQALPQQLGTTIRQAAFTTVSIQTTTGFCTSNYDPWPFLAHAVLVLLMFIGGCAGSTAGGIKVIRLIVVFKVMIAEIERVFRPKVIRPVRVGGSALDHELILSTFAYVLGFVILFAIGSCAIMLLEGAGCDYTTAATASIASLCTVGPGLGRVGPIENYSWMTDASKMVLSMLMAMGRLEVFAILVLFTPRFWRTD